MYANVSKTQSMKYTFLDGFLIRKGVRFRTAAILNGRTSRIGTLYPDNVILTY